MPLLIQGFRFSLGTSYVVSFVSRGRVWGIPTKFSVRYMDVVNQSAWVQKRLRERSDSGGSVISATCTPPGFPQSLGSLKSGLPRSFGAALHC